MNRRAGDRDKFLALLDSEIKRRRFAKLTAVGADQRRSLEQVLDEMAARLRAAPDWKEPPPAQQRRDMHKLETWFLRRGFFS